MSSNFYTDSYLKNYESTKAERNKEKEKISNIQGLLPEILKELKQVSNRLETIEKAMKK